MEYAVIVSRFQFVFMLLFAFNVGWYTANWSRAKPRTRVLLVHFSVIACLVLFYFWPYL